MPSGSRFETDLQALRAARGLSLSQIQQETRIPVDVLRRFEDGALIGDPTYNEVYLKAFLKSYAKAVGASPTDVVAAYRAQQSGGYDGALHPDHKASARAAAPDSVAAAPAAASVPEPAAEPAAPPPAAAAPAGVPKPVAGVREQPSRPSAPASSVSTARVSRPAVPSAKRSYDKNWGLIIGLFLGAVLVLSGLVYLLVFAGGPEAEDEATVETSTGTAQIDSSGIGAGAGSGGKRLQIPIRITVTAAGDKLTNFRVTEAPGERRPYWLEDGQSQSFESDSLIILWGEGADGVGPDARIELQGERWSPAGGQVIRIDRASGQRLLDSLATAPAQPAAQPSDDGA